VTSILLDQVKRQLPVASGLYIVDVTTPVKLDACRSSWMLAQVKRQLPVASGLYIVDVTTRSSRMLAGEATK